MPPSSKQDEASLINSNVVFVSQDMLMQEAVQLMIDRNISSVLVLNAEEEVVGILTERDIVRKFTLLDMADKLTHTVNTLMNRPVQFVHIKNLRQEITKLHLEMKVRHFPVLSGTDPKKSNVVGIISITDLARQSLLNSTSSRTEAHDDLHASQKSKVGILSANRANTNIYIDLFKGMGFKAVEVTNIHKFLTVENVEDQALIFDLDGYTDIQLHEFIPVAVKSKSHLILTTSNPALITLFKKYLIKDRQEIAMKPLDMGYISWLLEKRWHASGSPGT